MSTALFIVVSVIVAYGYCGPAPNFELFECRPGQQFIQNECNQCYCLKNEELVCQMNKCSHRKYYDLDNCRTGTVWWSSCNKCWCINSGTVCTMDRCY